MDILHTSFMETIANAINGPQLITDLIVRKAKEQGVTISDRQQRKIRNQLEQGADTIKWDSKSWKWWKKTDVKIELTQQDLDELETRVLNVIDRIPEIYQETLDDSATLILNELKKSWPEHASEQRRELDQFEERLRVKWEPVFDHLGMILTVASEAGAYINEECRKNPEPGKANLIEVLTRLQARACQVTSEVLVLITTGYADGAMARWRTLHEISVVGSFIRDGGEDMATRYRAHEGIESHKAALQYQAKSERLGVTPLSEDQLREIQETRDLLVETYGRPFASDHGWAAEALARNRPTFADIEETVGLDHLRPYYKMASHNVHANPKGVFFKLGLLPEEEVLLVGASDTGFGDPAQATAISLTQITGTMLSLKSTTDLLIAVKVMLALSDEIGQLLQATSK